MKEFGKRVRQLRLKTGYSQSQVVQYLRDQDLSITQSYLSRIEKGDREPGMDVQNALADLFNVSVDYLFGKEDRTIRLTDPLDEARAAPGLNDRESALINDYRCLNESGKNLAEAQVRGLKSVPPLLGEQPRIGAEYDDSLLIAASGAEGFNEEERRLEQADIARVLELKEKLGVADD